MKLYALALFYILGAYNIGAAQDAAPAANAILQPLYTKAVKENKKLLVIFHASWCGWCRKMDASLTDEKVKPLIDKYFITAHLTVYESADKKHLENAGALAMLTAHGGADNGLPYWMVFDDAGKLLADSQVKPGQNTGCPASEEEVAHWINVLKKTTSLKEDELEVIRERFRNNEM